MDNWKTARDNEFRLTSDVYGPLSLRIVYGPSLDVAYVPPTDGDNGNKYAAMISAVPEMLEALRALPLDEFDKPAEDIDAADFKDNAGAFIEAMRLARKAIAKSQSV